MCAWDNFILPSNRSLSGMDSVELSQPIGKQKKKQKKKTKAPSSERTAGDASNRESDESLQKLTKCLRISDCESLVNGDGEKHNNNASCANHSCTDERNSCSKQSDINVVETINLGNEKHTEQTHSDCNSIETLCNGIAHSSSPHDQPSTSFACTEIELKPSSPVTSSPVTSTADSTVNNPIPEQQDIVYKVYESELQMPDIMRLIQKDLSEPYSIYTYRYFIHNWPKLCFLAMHGTTCVGAIVCKLDIHRQQSKRGYIAMLAVDKDYRKLKIGTNLVAKAIQVSIP